MRGNVAAIAAALLAGCLSSPSEPGRTEEGTDGAGEADGSVDGGAEQPAGTGGDILYLTFDDRDAVRDQASPARAIDAVGGLQSVPDAVRGRAILLDGAQYLVLEDDPAFLPAEGLTFEVWVRQEVDGLSCVSFFTDQGSSDFEIDFGAICTGCTEDTAVLYTRGEAAIKTATAGADLPLSTWTHLAYTWDYDQVRIYRDGTLVGSTALTGPPAAQEGAWRIGIRPTGECAFQGALDEMKLSSRVKSAAEIEMSRSYDLGG